MILKDQHGMQETGIGPLSEPNCISGLCGDDGTKLGDPLMRGAPRQLPDNSKSSDIKESRSNCAGTVATLAAAHLNRPEDCLEKDYFGDQDKAGSPPPLNSLTPSPSRFNTIASLPPSEHHWQLAAAVTEAAKPLKRLEPLLPPADPGLLAQEDMSHRNPSPTRVHGRSRSIQPLAQPIVATGISEEEPVTSPLLPCGDPRDRMKIQWPNKLMALPGKVESIAPSSPTRGPPRDFTVHEASPTSVPSFCPGDQVAVAKGPIANSLYRASLSPHKAADIKPTDPSTFPNISPGLRPVLHQSKPGPSDPDVLLHPRAPLAPLQQDPRKAPPFSLTVAEALERQDKARRRTLDPLEGTPR
eukprot:GGOE01020326.1.p1 GENE.GGOE01020326.1~~GGOE01020326.1.p1  ORF type:complete len:357 (+),score=41.18 GGOE01020326.1:71-1141(+)